MRKETIHPDELMKPDLLCEIVLVVSGVAIFVPLLLLVVAMIARSPISH